MPCSRWARAGTHAPRWHKGIAPGAVRLKEERRVVLTLGEGEERLRELTGGAQVPPRLIRPPEAKQHREDLPGVPQPLAQCPRPSVGVFDFRGGKAPSGQQRRP
jgi:hypothetical protein